MNAANIISLARLLAAPLMVWLIVSGQWRAAFLLFVLAGVSDAVDGYLAKRFNMRTELGSYLDPLADKAMLMSVYVTLGVQAILPSWLVILIVSRDVLIVGAVLLAFAMDLRAPIRPLAISKVNTVMQIVLAAVVLGSRAMVAVPVEVIAVLVISVGITTLFSGAAYVINWAEHQRPGGGR